MKGLADSSLASPSAKLEKYTQLHANKAKSLKIEQ
jgi:hypothetical protein